MKIIEPINPALQGEGREFESELGTEEGSVAQW